MIREDSIDRIMTVMHAAFDPQFGEAWNRRQVEDALILGNCHHTVVNSDGDENVTDAPAGFTLSRTGYEEEELLLIAVHPELRRRGLGERLIERLAVASSARGARRLLLEMRRGNPAVSLYLRCGFIQIGERPNYYRLQSGERIDAITFARMID